MVILGIDDLSIRDQLLDTIYLNILLRSISSKKTGYF